MRFVVFDLGCADTLLCCSPRHPSGLNAPTTPPPPSDLYDASGRLFRPSFPPPAKPYCAHNVASLHGSFGPPKFRNRPDPSSFLTRNPRRLPKVSPPPPPTRALPAESHVVDLDIHVIPRRALGLRAMSGTEIVPRGHVPSPRASTTLTKKVRRLCTPRHQTPPLYTLHPPKSKTRNRVLGANCTGSAVSCAGSRGSASPMPCSLRLEPRHGRHSVPQSRRQQPQQWRRCWQQWRTYNGGAD